MLTQTGRGYPKGANLLDCKVCLGSASKTVTHLKGIVYSKCQPNSPRCSFYGVFHSYCQVP